jgi:hypothetical protein
VNKVRVLLGDLLEAETDLARAYRAIGEHQAAEHDIYYVTQTLASQCEEHAAQLHKVFERFDRESPTPGVSEGVRNVMASLRGADADVVGRESEPGLALLRDLRQLYLMAEEVNVHWLALRQVAQATRDLELLQLVSQLQEETRTQLRWMTTRLKECAPQVLVVGAVSVEPDPAPGQTRLDQPALRGPT